MLWGLPNTLKCMDVGPDHCYQVLFPILAGTGPARRSDRNLTLGQRSLYPNATQRYAGTPHPFPNTLYLINGRPRIQRDAALRRGRRFGPIVTLRFDHLVLRGLFGLSDDSEVPPLRPGEAARWSVSVRPCVNRPCNHYCISKTGASIELRFWILTRLLSLQNEFISKCLFNKSD